MKFPAPVSVQWIADMIHAEVAGNTTTAVLGINEIHKVEKGDLVFVDHPKYYDTCLKRRGFYHHQYKKKLLYPKGKPFNWYLIHLKHTLQLSGIFVLLPRRINRSVMIW